MTLILSGFHINEMLSKKNGEIINISLNLGISKSKVEIGDYIKFPDGQKISRKLLERVMKKKKLNDCFLIENNELFWIYVFNEEEHHSYKLYEPNIDWPPTLWIDGAFMHTIAKSTPLEEAKNKVDALNPKNGTILETCMGLGYCTKIMLGYPIEKIIACEISSDVIDIAKLNPWSKEIFSDDRVVIKNEDILNLVDEIPPNSVDHILHDPPTLHRAGDLYSKNLYSKLLSVLKKGGKMYHYIGTETEKTKHRYKQGVIKRLTEVGFSKVASTYRGVYAQK